MLSYQLCTDPQNQIDDNQSPSDPYPGAVYPNVTTSNTALIVLVTVIPCGVALCTIVSLTVFLCSRKKQEPPKQVDDEAPQGEKQSLNSFEIRPVPTPQEEVLGPKDTEVPFVSVNPMDEYIV